MQFMEIFKMQHKLAIVILNVLNIQMLAVQELRII